MSGALEFTKQQDCFLRAGAVGQVTCDDFESVVGVGLGRCRVIIGELHSRTSDFIRKVGVRRRDYAVAGWVKWILEDLLVHQGSAQARSGPSCSLCAVWF